MPYKNPKKQREWCQNRYQRIKKEALIKISGEAICVYCGCNDIRILEINHKYLGGSKERKDKPCNVGHGLYIKITNGLREVNDLEVLCRVCNALHYVKKKFDINNFKIKWS